MPLVGRCSFEMASIEPMGAAPLDPPIANKSLLSAKANTPAGDPLEVTRLVEAYERVQFPIDLPDAVEAIKFRMAHSGTSRM
jgi:hypothetical protein